jgi:hypothetical protein
MVTGNQPSQGTQYGYNGGTISVIQTCPGGGASNLSWMVPNGTTYYWTGNNGANINTWWECS